MKRLFTILASLVAASASLGAANGNSFAIVVDNASYSHCKESINAYCEAVRNGGLDAFIAAQDWQCPEQLKDSLIKWHAGRSLEGAVFVGDIPIPMVRQAQFLTSAFKMDENGSFEWRDCSVPSDRFYDDFDLKFDYIKRDSLETNFFYYNLAGDGKQAIDCDIYTARIKPSSAWEDKYVELDNYFRKLVAVKAETGNRLDNFCSFTGEGSFSNSMVAWVDETQTMKEKAPDAYETADGARFYVFEQQPIMKYLLLDAACDDNSDLFFFHCHGTPERQWIGGFIDAEQFQPKEEPESYEEMYNNMYQAEYDLAKYQARLQYRRLLRYHTSPADAKQRMLDRYGIDSTWYEGAEDPEVVKADSLLDIETGIVLSDVQKYDTDSRMMIFDACYNGDFREDDNIATRYIMGHGKTVVTIGNSVNVLQDKDASPLLGMLSCGYSVGQWQQQVNILESHIIGDPTFKFAPSYDFYTEMPDISSTDIEYWKGIVCSNCPADIKGLALQKLVNLGCPDAAKILHDTYFSSDSYCLRLQAMLQLLKFDSPLTVEVLTTALDDPYEFIRRKAAHFLTLRGDDSSVEPLVEAYFHDYNATRVQFNILYGSGMFKEGAFRKAFDKKLDDNCFVFDTVAFKNQAYRTMESSDGIAESCLEALTDTTLSPRRRSVYCNMLRNNPYPFLADNVIALVANPDESTKLRTECAEILGWYNYAWNRADIITRLEQALPSISDETVAKEVTKTINRLKEYTK